MSSKRYNKLPKGTKSITSESTDKLISTIKKNCTTKFDESIDLNLQINNKQKKSEINLRTVVNLPSGTGKKIKVAVVCEDANMSEAKGAGADIIVNSSCSSTGATPAVAGAGATAAAVTPHFSSSCFESSAASTTVKLDNFSIILFRSAIIFCIFIGFIFYFFRALK